MFVVKIIRRGKYTTRYLVSNGDTLVIENDHLYEVGEEIKLLGNYQEVSGPLITFKSRRNNNE